MEKKIKIQRKEIRRHGVHLSLTQERTATIGSYLNRSGSVGTGLTFEEIKKWMPSIIGVEPTDPKFRLEVEKYFNNITIPIPYEGKILNIGFDEELNEPYDLMDYIRYKFILTHPLVAENKVVSESMQTKMYYIEDEQLELDKKSAKLMSKTKAILEFAKLLEDEVKQDWVLRRLTMEMPELGSVTSITNLKKQEKDLKMEEAYEKKPNLLLEIVSDPDLEYKAQIASFVEAKVIQKVGNNYIYGSEPLGELNQTIAYLKSPNNSESYAIMLAKLKQLDLGMKTKEVKKVTK
jgi:hypothetical protein